MHTQPLQQVIPRNKTIPVADRVVLCGFAAASAQIKINLPLSCFSWASAKDREENLSPNNNDSLLEWKLEFAPQSKRGRARCKSFPHPACQVSSLVLKGRIGTVAERDVCLHSPFYSSEVSVGGSGEIKRNRIFRPYKSSRSGKDQVGMYWCENGEGEWAGTHACFGKRSLSASAKLLAPIYHINTQTFCLLV